MFIAGIVINCEFLLCSFTIKLLPNCVSLSYTSMSLQQLVSCHAAYLIATIVNMLVTVVLERSDVLYPHAQYMA